MTSSRRRTFLRVLAAGFTLLALATAMYANHSWGGYHWARTSNPFTLKVGDNVNSTWDPYLNEAISDWSASSVLDLTKVTGQAKGSCRPTAGRIEVCNKAYGANGWLGLAQIWITGGTHITQGTSKMNDTYFNTAQYNTPAWRRLVMCQEIAHDFGLDHQDEAFNNGNLGSCMDYTSDPDGPPSNEHPNSHDFQQLLTIYGHTDSTTTISQTTSPHPGPMNSIEFEGPGQWGKLVRRTHDGGAEVYEQDFGRGHKVVTFVIWTVEERDRRAHSHE